MTKQKGIRVTCYMSEREKGMLDAICASTSENMSQMVTALIMQEYYRLKNMKLVTSSLVETLNTGKE